MSRNNKRRNKRIHRQNPNEKTDAQIVENKTEVSNTSDDIKLIKVPRACVIGTPNINGILYEEKSYRTALEKINSNPDCYIWGEVFITTQNPYKNFGMREFTNIDCVNCIKVHEVGDDYVMYEVNDQTLFNFINRCIEEKISVSAHMRMLAKQTVDDPKVYSINEIIGFDLFIKKDFEFTSYAEMRSFSKTVDSVDGE